MKKFLDRITTVAEDTSKHIVGAVYLNFIAMVATAFLGDTIGMWITGSLLVGFVGWEIYWNITKETPFSFKDVFVAAIVIAPALMYIIKINYYL